MSGHLPKPCAEDHVQNAARAVLDELGSVILDQARASGRPLPDGDPGLLWWHTPNEALNRQKKYDPRQSAAEREAERRESMMFGSFLVGQGVKAGVEDITIDEAPPAHPDAKGVRIELKKVGGYASEDQDRVMAAHRRRGYVTLLVKGTHALLDALRVLGWPVDEALRRLSERGETIDATGRVQVDTAKAKRWAQARETERLAGRGGTT